MSDLPDLTEMLITKNENGVKFKQYEHKTLKNLWKIFGDFAFFLTMHT